jgi:hypothetical protein
LDKKSEKEAKKAARQAEKEEKLKARQEKEAKDRKMAGRLVLEEQFDLRSIKIYENGYVVFGPSIGSPVYEKLRSFNVYDGNVAKKTGVGRSAMAVLTVGANLGASSNMRGDVIITVVTERKTHTSKLNATPGTLKSAQKIRTALDSVMQSGSNESDVKGKSESDLGASIEKLVALRDSGALSPEEFEKAKAKLLE